MTSPWLDQEDYDWNPDQEALARHLANAAAFGGSHVIATTTAIGIPRASQGQADTPDTDRDRTPHRTNGPS